MKKEIVILICKKPFETTGRINFLIGEEYIAQLIGIKEYMVFTHFQQPFVMDSLLLEQKFNIYPLMTEVDHHYLINKERDISEHYLSEIIEFDSRRLKVDKVYQGDKTTVLKFSDGTKVKSVAEDIYSQDEGVLMCLAKKLLGSYSNVESVLAMAETSDSEGENKT